MAYMIFSKHSLEVEITTRTYWEYPFLKQNFFEVILIIEGSGRHHLNDLTFDYCEGDVFLLTPEDRHEFEIIDTTKFGYIRFTEQLLAEKTGKDSNSRWRQKISHTLLNPNAIPGNSVLDVEDRQHIFQIFDILHFEFEKKDAFSRQTALELFGAIMVIIARNLDQKAISAVTLKSKEEEKISDILAYIREYILDKNKMQLENVAHHFFLSPNYLSIYLKKHTGLSFQKLITTTKMLTAERLLMQSELTISEIAYRLGYVDASHFHKVFKKHSGKSPKRFRTE